MFQHSNLDARWKTLYEQSKERCKTFVPLQTQNNSKYLYIIIQIIFKDININSSIMRNFWLCKSNLSSKFTLNYTFVFFSILNFAGLLCYLYARFSICRSYQYSLEGMTLFFMQIHCPPRRTPLIFFLVLVVNKINQ